MKTPSTASFAVDLPKWRQVQAAYSQQPLEFCPEFPRIAARHESWWRCELEGPPLVLASISKNPGVDGGRRLELLTKPERWMEARLEQLSSTLLIGDALPSIRVDYGPVCIGMLTGAPVEFVSGTTWTHRIINDDWSNEPDWQIHENNPWWQLLPRLLKLNAEHARGRYIAMTPSLGGSADLLLNTRGAEQLCMDIVDQPERIAAAVAAIYQAWQKGIECVWKSTMDLGIGTINWVGLWSNVPYYVLECDFNYMIGPRAFQKLFLPDIVRQGSQFDRSIFHLDGPGAAKHITALLDCPEITAIQYVTGAGNSVMAHLKMLQEIQRRGRPLQVTVTAREAAELSRSLDPCGLCLLIDEIHSLEEIQAVYAEICRHS